MYGRASRWWLFWFAGFCTGGLLLRYCDCTLRDQATATAARLSPRHSDFHRAHATVTNTCAVRERKRAKGWQQHSRRRLRAPGRPRWRAAANQGGQGDNAGASEWRLSTAIATVPGRSLAASTGCHQICSWRARCCQFPLLWSMIQYPALLCSHAVCCLLAPSFHLRALPLTAQRLLPRSVSLGPPPPSHSPSDPLQQQRDCDGVWFREKQRPRQLVLLTQTSTGETWRTVAHQSSSTWAPRSKFKKGKGEKTTTDDHQG